MRKDLKDMTRKELEKMLEDVKKALVNAQARERRQARVAAEKAAAQFGYSLGDLTEDVKRRPGRPKGSKAAPKKGKPKFRNPADPSQTWTGKGRKPNWFVEEINKGTPADAMSI